jgi:hypothetical protein
VTTLNSRPDICTQSYSDAFIGALAIRAGSIYDPLKTARSGILIRTKKGGAMSKSNHTQAQIIDALKQVEVGRSA